ncbi:hypothetical protein COOONC_15205 [Cooperia oncophora]
MENNINFVDESLDSDSEEDDLSIAEGEGSKDPVVLSAILVEAANILRRRGLYSVKEHFMVDQNKVLDAVNHFEEDFPELLDDFLTDSDDTEARNVKILFAGVVMEALGKQSALYIGSLLRFADVMIAICRARVLPDNFDIQLLSTFVMDCGRHEAFVGNLCLPEDDTIACLLEA